MSFPTDVNNQITDAVTQANVKVLGESPAMAMGSLYQTMAHSTGILFQNAVSAQQQQNTLAQAASNMGVMQIYSMNTMAGAAATRKCRRAASRTTWPACLPCCKASRTGKFDLLLAYALERSAKKMVARPYVEVAL